MLTSWLEAWTSYSLTTRRLHSKVSIYRGLVFAAGSAFGMARDDVAVVHGATTLKLKDSTQLEASLALATQAMLAVNVMAKTALATLRQRVAQRMAHILAAQAADPLIRHELHQLATSNRLTPRAAMEELLCEWHVQAGAVCRLVNLHRSRLRKWGLITTDDRGILKLMATIQNIARTLKMLQRMEEADGLQEARRNAGSATMHHLESLAALMQDGACQLEQEVDRGLAPSRQALTGLLQALHAEITRITQDREQFEPMRGLGLASAESLLMASFAGDSGSVSVLSRLLLEAPQQADPSRYGLSFDDLLRTAFALYASYPYLGFAAATERHPALAQHIQAFAPIAHDADAYCAREGIHSIAARRLVSRIWLMALMHRQLSAEPSPAVRQQSRRVFVAYLDLFFQKHSRDGRYRNCIEAPLVYWSRGLHMPAQDCRDDMAWPHSPEGLPRLRRLLEQAGMLFGWNLILDPPADDDDEPREAADWGRRCNDEYCVHNDWKSPRQGKTPPPHAFNQIYALMRPPLAPVPAHAAMNTSLEAPQP